MLRYYKGLQYLIEAMRDIPASCQIIGEGPERARLEQQIKRAGLSERVQLLGELSDEEKHLHLYAADLFCLPSHLRSEAFGLSQIEAMAAGLPVISCDIDTGVPFVNQDGRTGLLAQPGNSASLKDKILQLLNDDALRKQLGTNARKRAFEEFSAETMIQRVVAVYNELLNQA